MSVSKGIAGKDSKVSQSIQPFVPRIRPNVAKSGPSVYPI